MANGDVFDAAGLVLADGACRGPARTPFRRTLATWMDASGAPLAEIANQLGHADVNPPGYLGRRQASTRAATVMTLDSSDTAQ